MAAGITIVLTLQPAIAQPCPAADKEKHYVTNVGRIEEGTVQPLLPDGKPEMLKATTNGTRHFRVRVRAHGPMPKDWRLTFYDWEMQHPLQIMSPRDLRGKNVFWSRRFEGDRGQVLLQGPDARAAPFLKIDGAILVGRDARISYYSVADRNDLKWQCLSCPRLAAHEEVCKSSPISCRVATVDARRRGLSVGMMMMFGEQDAWTCSGFLVAPSLFLTNWHCGGRREQAIEIYWDNDALRNLVIDFSWDGDEVSNEYGWSGDPAYETKSIKKNVASDRDLDYAIFRIKPLLQSIGEPPVARIGRNATLSGGMPIDIIHHPEGRVKHLTEQNCRIEAVDHPSWVNRVKGVDFLHECDTEGGSSGAPVFAEGRVIGVHHSGHTEENGVCDKKNKAVKIDRILDHLPEKLRNEILAAQ